MSKLNINKTIDDIAKLMSAGQLKIPKNNPNETIKKKDKKKRKKEQESIFDISKFEAVSAILFDDD